MVSKTLIISLAVCCLAGFGSCFILGGGSSTDVNLDVCVNLLNTIKGSVQLDLDLSGLIAKVLHLAGGVVNSVLGLLGGVLGGGSGQHVPCPKNLDTGLGFIFASLKVLDLSLQAKLGGLYTSLALSNTYGYVCRQTLLKANVDLSTGFEYLHDLPTSFVDVSADIDLILGLDAEALAGLDINVNAFLPLILKAQLLVNLVKTQCSNGITSLTVLGKCTTIAINAVVGFGKTCGYKDADLTAAVSVYVGVYSDLLGTKYGGISQPDIDYSNFCSRCL